MQNTVPIATAKYFQTLFQEMQYLDSLKEQENGALVNMIQQNDTQLEGVEAQGEHVDMMAQVLTALRPQTVDQTMIQIQVDNLLFCLKDYELELQNINKIVAQQEQVLSGLDLQLSTLRTANTLTQDRMALFSQLVQQKANDTIDFQRDNDALLVQDIANMKMKLSENGYDPSLDSSSLAQLDSQIECLKREKESTLGDFINEECIPVDKYSAKQIMAHLRLHLTNLKMSK